MKPLRAAAVIIIFFTLTGSRPSYGFELKTGFASVIWEKEDLLRKFNREFRLGSLSYLIGNKSYDSAEEEVAAKVDALVVKIETILDMFPPKVKFRIILLKDDDEVRQAYKARYGRTVDYIAFYSPREKTVYISVDDMRLGVLAHEMAHMILDHYFGAPPPAKIHEVLAQYVEAHLRD